MSRHFNIDCSGLGKPVGRLLTAATLSIVSGAATGADALTGNSSWQSRNAVNADSRQIFAHLERIDEAELAELRGGLSVAGIEMKFGATLRSLIDNIQLTTVYRVTQTGVEMVSQILESASVADFAQQSRTAAQPANNTGSAGLAKPVTLAWQPQPSTTATASATLGTQAATGTGQPVASATLVGPTTGTSVTDLAPASIDLSGVANYRGLVVNDVKGFTAALHNISRKAVVSSLISNASGRKTSQRLNLDVRLLNVEQVRAAALRSVLTRAGN